MLISTFVFALMNVCVKLVPGIPAIEVVFFRSVISLVLSLGILWRLKVPIFGKNRLYLILRGLFGAVALTLYFLTLQRIPLATAVILQFLAPIFTVIFGYFIVNEKFYPLQLLFLLISLAGILLIRQFDERLSWVFIVAGITASIFAGLAYNMIRKIKTSEHPLVIILYFPLVTTPLSGIYSATNWVMPQGREWLLLLAIGVLTQIAQFFLTRAYQLEEISKVASIKYIGIFFALGFGYLFFDESFNIMTYVGMALVMVGVLANLIYKAWRDKKEYKKRQEELSNA